MYAVIGETVLAEDQQHRTDHPGEMCRTLINNAKFTLSGVECEIIARQQPLHALVSDINGV
jgi:hypothetical protein